MLRFQKIRFLGLIAIFPLLLGYTLSCSEKPQQILYLAPLDRNQEGFLDPETYQLLSYGYALDFSKPIDIKNTFMPSRVDDHFDNEAFVEFNNSIKKPPTDGKVDNKFPLAEIMQAEANHLNPLEINLSVIDEKIRAPMEIKRALFDNACTHARIQGLYRWLMIDYARMNLLHGATLPNEGAAKIGLDTKFFPPRAFYQSEFKLLLENLDKIFHKNKTRFEIVQEVFSKPEKLECKVALHFHKRKMQVAMPYLVPH